jgi:hypothetical protein
MHQHGNAVENIFSHPQGASCRFISFVRTSSASISRYFSLSDMKHEALRRHFYPTVRCRTWQMTKKPRDENEIQKKINFLGFAKFEKRGAFLRCIIKTKVSRSCHISRIAISLRENKGEIIRDSMNTIKNYVFVGMIQVRQLSNTKKKLLFQIVMQFDNEI